MKTPILLLLLSLSLLALEPSTKLEVKIIQKVLSEITIDKEKIIWSDNTEIQRAIEKKGLFQTTTECKRATIAIVQNKKTPLKKCPHAIVFVLDYDLLSKIPKSFGAFFWKKARPNIVILRPRLKTLFIQVSKDLNPYIEDKIW